jgi:DUF1009 family protein
VAEPVGLIAGLGRFPIEVARAARRRGRTVVAVPILALAEPGLAGEVDDSQPLHLGELGRLVQFFRAAGVRELVMAGKVPKTFLYERAADLHPDAMALEVLAGLADRKDDSILGAVADRLEREGFRLLGQAELAPELRAGEGALSRVRPDPGQWRELCFAWPLARALGRLDVGQTVVVRGRAAMALEAIEGTDAAIRRGAALGGAGCCVVKLAKPHQDPRFDVPTVGPETARTCAEAGVAVLAVEAERTVVLERETLVAIADEAGLAVVAARGEDAPEPLP